MSGWVESGPWSIKQGRQAALERAFPIATYSTGKLTGWREKLLKKSRKLPKLGTKKRQRLRLLNKKLSDSVEFFDDLCPGKSLSTQQAALRPLPKTPPPVCQS